MNELNNKDLSPESWGWSRHFYTAWMETLMTEPRAVSWFPARIYTREHHQYGVVCPVFSTNMVPPMGQSEPESVLKTGFYDGLRVSGRFEYQTLNPGSYPAVGDWVLLEDKAGTLRIQQVLSRNSSLSRNSAGLENVEQILAANLDIILLVFGLDGGRNFNVRLLERALTTAWNSGAQPVVILNKADCAADEHREHCMAEARYTAAQVPVLSMSARSGEGLEQLQSFLLPGQTIGMLGKSGVGKSALLNALLRFTIGNESASQTLAREGQQRKSDLQGRHTTSSSRLYRLPGGALIIDGPGIRELQLWSDGEDLDRSFPEIEELAEYCRFRDCTHSGEPGCAVQDALARGELDQGRFISWLDLRKEQAWLERRVDQRARLEEKEKWKKIGKYIKQLKKDR